MFPLQRKTSAYKLRSRAEGAYVKVFYVYVLRSQMDSGLYIGYSSNLRERLRQHDSRTSFATAHRGPWKLVYYEAYLNQADAFGREKYLKSGAGRRFLKAQLRHYLSEEPLE
jgi:putative endonuclease